MANELGILLSGKLDIANTTAKVNRDIKSIQSQLNNLHLNIDTSRMTKEMQQMSQNLNKQMSNIGKGTGNIGQQLTDSVSIDLDQLRKNNSQVFKEIDKLKKHYNGSISSIQRSGGIEIANSNEIEKLQKVRVGIKDLNGVLRNFNIQQQDGKAKIIGFNEVNNIEKAQKQTQKLIEKKKRERQVEKEKIKDLKHKLDLEKRQAKIDVQNLRSNKGDFITKEQNQQLKNYLTNMNNLSSATPDVQRKIQSMKKDFKQVSANIQETGANANTLGQELKTALARVNW